LIVAAYLHLLLPSCFCKVEEKRREEEDREACRGLID
jgi:hypothetical protein